MVNGSIKEEMLIADIIEQYPSTKEVFEKYGVCSGGIMPRETLGFFARAHQIELQMILAELNNASRRPHSTKNEATVPGESIGEALWRRFFKSGIILGFIGWTFGAINLAYIAFNRSYFELPIHVILSHAHLQIFGWVGLFVMGFAYQAFPRFKFVSLWNPRLAMLSFWIMLLSILITALSWALLPSKLFFVLGILGSFLELIGISIFLLVMVKTMNQAMGKRQFWEKYVFTALMLFLIQAIFNPLSFYLVGDASLKGNMSLLIGRVAGFIAPYQDVQLFGFITMMIFGVSQRFIPFVFNIKEPSKRLGDFSFYTLFISIFLALSINILTHSYGLKSLRPFILIPYTGLLVSSVGVIINAGVLGRAKAPTRELKFIRAAYVWLVISILLLLILPFYSQFILGAFSHNYFGAYRHALTVGFISLMIMGVAAKVTPIMSGIEPRNALLIPFILVNVGNVVRVASQILSDFQGVMSNSLAAWNGFFLASSGFIQVIGFSLWAYDIWGTANEGIRLQKERSLPTGRPDRVEKFMKVGEVLNYYPQLEEVFLKFGFKDITNPVLRRTVARTITLEMACRMHSVNIDEFLHQLNSRIKG
ncbi:MAG TPA: DUF1858 domain-containing protein [Thermodesulfobacteriota bacterium]|nr:DUF1858 domain-containing protein [Thermodesulfobacteriota bacterium]